MKKTKHILIASIISTLGATTSVFASHLIPVQEEEPRPLATMPTSTVIPMTAYTVDLNDIFKKAVEHGCEEFYCDVTPGKAVDVNESHFSGHLKHHVSSFADTSSSESHSEKSRGASKFGLSFKGLDVTGSGGSKSSSSNTCHTTNIQDQYNDLERRREEDVMSGHFVQQPGLTLKISFPRKNTALQLVPLKSLEQLRFEKLNLPQIGSSQVALPSSQSAVPRSEDEELKEALSGF